MLSRSKDGDELGERGECSAMASISSSSVSGVEGRVRLWFRIGRGSIVMNLIQGDSDGRRVVVVFNSSVKKFWRTKLESLMGHVE